jgi:hypothetical protein
MGATRVAMPLWERTWARPVSRRSPSRDAVVGADPVRDRRSMTNRMPITRCGCGSAPGRDLCRVHAVVIRFAMQLSRG